MSETPVLPSDAPAAPAAPSPLAIDARGLTKVFGGKPAVDGLTLQVARGRFFGFLGPNGAGKSTTIKMLTGLLRPTSGEAFIEGRGLATDPLAVKRRHRHPARGAAALRAPDRRGVPALRRPDVRPREARRRASGPTSCSSSCRSRTIAGKLILDYSQGMRKKMALAAALIHNPRVLFLDEPLNGIDPVSGRVVTDLLRRLARKGVTLFFTTHVLDVVERLCDEVAIIDRGRIVAQGTLDDIRTQREVARTRPSRTSS